MKIALRADASDEIGAGHVMRQVALAQYLVSAGFAPTLFASVKGATWLQELIRQCSGLTWEIVKEGEFSANFCDGEDFSAVVIDSYEVKNSQLRSIEAVVPKVAVIVDGPSESLNGRIAIAPTLNPSPNWSAGLNNRFEAVHIGPQFIPLRQDVIQARERKYLNGMKDPVRITVAIGGFGSPQHVEAVLRSLSTSVNCAVVEVFGMSSKETTLSEFPDGLKVLFRSDQTDFLRSSLRSQLAIIGCGTTLIEMGYLGIPVVCLVVAGNQEENAVMAKKIGFGVPVHVREPDISLSLQSAILEQLSTKQVSNQRDSQSSVIDAHGAKRIIDAVLAYR